MYVEGCVRKEGGEEGGEKTEHKGSLKALEMVTPCDHKLAGNS